MSTKVSGWYKPLNDKCKMFIARDEKLKACKKIDLIRSSLEIPSRR